MDPLLREGRRWLKEENETYAYRPSTGGTWGSRGTVRKQSYLWEVSILASALGASFTSGDAGGRRVPGARGSNRAQGGGNAHLVGAYSEPDRDPQGHNISCAYLAPCRERRSFAWDRRYRGLLPRPLGGRVGLRSREDHRRRPRWAPHISRYLTLLAPVRGGASSGAALVGLVPPV